MASPTTYEDPSAAIGFVIFALIMLLTLTGLAWWYCRGGKRPITAYRYQLVGVHALLMPVLLLVLWLNVLQPERSLLNPDTPWFVGVQALPTTMICLVWLVGFLPRHALLSVRGMILGLPRGWHGTRFTRPGLLFPCLALGLLIIRYDFATITWLHILPMLIPLAMLVTEYFFDIDPSNVKAASRGRHTVWALFVFIMFFALPMYIGLVWAQRTFTWVAFTYDLMLLLAAFSVAMVSHQFFDVPLSPAIKHIDQQMMMYMLLFMLNAFGGLVAFPLLVWIFYLASKTRRMWTIVAIPFMLMVKTYIDYLSQYNTLGDRNPFGVPGSPWEFYVFLSACYVVIWVGMTYLPYPATFHSLVIVRDVVMVCASLAINAWSTPVAITIATLWLFPGVMFVAHTTYVYLYPLLMGVMLALNSSEEVVGLEGGRFGDLLLIMSLVSFLLAILVSQPSFVLQYLTYKFNAGKRARWRAATASNSSESSGSHHRRRHERSDSGAQVSYSNPPLLFWPWYYYFRHVPFFHRNNHTFFQGIGERRKEIEEERGRLQSPGLVVQLLRFLEAWTDRLVADPIELSGSAQMARPARRKPARLRSPGLTTEPQPSQYYAKFFQAYES